MEVLVRLQVPWHAMVPCGMLCGVVVVVVVTLEGPAMYVGAVLDVKWVGVEVGMVNDCGLAGM